MKIQGRSNVIPMNTIGTSEEHQRNIGGKDIEAPRKVKGTSKEHVRKIKGESKEHQRKIRGTSKHPRETPLTSKENRRNIQGTCKKNQKENRRNIKGAHRRPTMWCSDCRFSGVRVDHQCGVVKEREMRMQKPSARRNSRLRPSPSLSLPSPYGSIFS